jgi:hypothetical protein
MQQQLLACGALWFCGHWETVKLLVTVARYGMLAQRE